MNAQDSVDFDAHEDVRIFDLGEQGVHAIIAVHSTYRGPAAGGCRLWRYDAPGEALTDALRLSRGMSYKNALADLPFGGGKAVILAPSVPFDRVRLFEAFGRAVDSLNGRYITAEDVGSSVADMKVVSTQTLHVGGLPPLDGQAGGDPSPWTALGVFLSLRTALNWKLGRGLAGARVSVQGAGAVGAELCRLLGEAGAQIILADIDPARAAAVAAATGAQVVGADEIHRTPAHIFAPCALGGVLNGFSVGELGAPIVCGAANNQLAAAEVAASLDARGVLYCPDYVVNAGGIIAVHGESAGQTNAAVERAVRAIPGRLAEIFETSQVKGLTPVAVADQMARERIGRGPIARAAPTAADLATADADIG